MRSIFLVSLLLCPFAAVEKIHYPVDSTTNPCTLTSYMPAILIDKCQFKRPGHRGLNVSASSVSSESRQSARRKQAERGRVHGPVCSQPVNCMCEKMITSELY